MNSLLQLEPAGSGEYRSTDELDCRNGVLDLAPFDHRAAQELGHVLFSCLFPPAIRSRYDQSLGRLSGEEDRGLRIKIKLDLDDGTGELHELPWELMFRAETQEFLGLSRRSPIVRYLDVPRASHPIPLPRTLRVLLVSAGPDDQRSLELHREAERIRRSLAKTPEIELDFLRDSSLRDLRNQLLQKSYHALHFVGHGTYCDLDEEGALLFEAPDGTSEPVTGGDLATVLGDFRSLQLVFLNACETARTSDQPGLNPFSGVAPALVRGGVPAVVAMRAPISDLAAIELGSIFYRRLAAGDAVDTALTESRQALYLHHRRGLEWSTPVLFMRVADGRIFRPPGSRPSKRRQIAIATLILTLAGGPLGYLATKMASPDPPVEIPAEGEDVTEAEKTNPAEGSGGAEPAPHPPKDAPDQPRETAASHSRAGETERSNTPYFQAPKEVSLIVDRIDPEETAPEAHLRPLEESTVEQLPQFADPIQAHPRSPGAVLIRYSLQDQPKSSLSGLSAVLQRVEHLPSGRLRWVFEFQNRTGRDLALHLPSQSTKMFDHQGLSYQPTSSSPAEPWKLPKGTTASQWFEFPALSPEASNLKISLGHFPIPDGGSVGFSQARILLQPSNQANQGTR